MKPAAYRKLAREDSIQVAIVQWIRLHKELEVFHVPNEGRRTKAEGDKLLKMGMLPGVSDLVVLWPGGGVGFVEVKTARGRATNEQKMFRARCCRLGHRYGIVRSVAELESLLREWRAIGPRRWLVSDVEYGEDGGGSVVVLAGGESEALRAGADLLDTEAEHLRASVLP